METARILSTFDLDKIEEAENNTWVTHMQAPKEKIRTRIENQHQIMGYMVDGNIGALVCWCYRPEKLSQEGMSKDFGLFSSGACTPEQAGAAYIYNVGVPLNFRRQHLGTKSVRAAFEMMKSQGVTDVFLDGRCPSYNGSSGDPKEYIEQSPDFKKRVDECIEKGELPTVDDMMLDPTLRFYAKLGFKPYVLLPNFYPEDHASGGNRLIVYQKLE